MSATLEDFKNNRLTEAHESNLLSAAMEAVYAERLDTQLTTDGIFREKPESKTINLRPMFLAAAVVCLLFAAFLFFKPHNDPIQIADVQIENALGQYDLQTRATTIADNQAEIKAAFGAKDFKRALDLLTADLEAETDEAKQQKNIFYQGLAKIHQGDYHAAAESFQTVQSKKGIYTKDATWMLALSYIKTSNMGAAKVELQKVAGMTAWIKSKDAEKILDSME